MEEYHIWRLIIAGIATLEELETTWSLDDVERGNAALNAKEALQAELVKNITPKGKK